jgi:hypothetical protein
VVSYFLPLFLLLPLLAFQAKSNFCVQQNVENLATKFAEKARKIGHSERGREKDWRRIVVIIFH